MMITKQLEAAKREKFYIRRNNEAKIDELEYILSLIDEYPEVTPIDIIEHRLESLVEELEELSR